MSKLIHSFWTAPSMIPRYGYKTEQLFLNLWYFSLSCAYAKHNGAEIVLHTDTLGERLFGHLPYDSIHTTLDDIQTPPRFWASSKFYALQAEQDEKAIHIDGDVFIKKPELLERMFSSNADLLVQYIEPWLDTNVRDRLAQYITKDYFCHHEMYNTGVLGIFNKNLKDNILNTYFTILNECKEKLPNSLLNDQNFTPDLVCEQQMIAHKSVGYNIDYLIKDYFNPLKEANEIGFQHVLSTSKFRELDKCKRELMRVDINIYNKTKRICQNI